MSSQDYDNPIQTDLGPGPQWELVPVEVVDTPPSPPPPWPPRRRILRPLILFIATCLSTLLVGWWQYAVPLMTILVCHEMGHFLQTRRYGVFSSYPYFIPLPISPIGTIGAVIFMEPRIGDRRALFDIGISGPLAGLVPTLIFCVWGLHLSHFDFPMPGKTMPIGEPLIFHALAEAIRGQAPPGQDLILHPMAFAGWVGLLITSLNLMPIGQLDGGHVLYGLLRSWAHPVAKLVLVAAIAAVMFFGLYSWMLMLFLLVLMGPVHPPTANDDVPLGPVRIALGWLILAFIPFGFTPNPFAIQW